MDIVLLAIVIILLAAIAWRLFRGAAPSQPQQDSQSLIMLQNRIEEIARTLDTRLGSNEKTFLEQSNKNTEIVSRVYQELEKVSATNNQVISATDSLKDLQNILRNPKQRGVVGEYILKNLLENVFPPGQYEMQYKFKDETIVDAIVKTSKGIVPVDSKFSMENYNRINATNDESEKERYQTVLFNDLKTRIDETSKYVKPEEDTLDFAFMFIPSEVLFYDLLTRKIGVRGDEDLIKYAMKKKVVIVSPTTFFAYLQTVLYGLKALHIEEGIKQITKNVGELGKHLVTYQDQMQRVGKNLTTTVSAYNAMGKEFGKINKDIYRGTGKELGLEAPSVEKPEDSVETMERLL